MAKNYISLTHATRVQSDILTDAAQSTLFTNKATCFSSGRRQLCQSGALHMGGQYERPVQSYAVLTMKLSGRQREDGVMGRWESFVASGGLLAGGRDAWSPGKGAAILGAPQEYSPII